MKASELITVLQALIAEHGDLPVKVDDQFVDNPEDDVIHVDLGTYPEPFIHIGPAAYYTMPDLERLRRTMSTCPIDHWSWDPEHVDRGHGEVLRRAGITDLDAWVARERLKEILAEGISPP